MRGYVSFVLVFICAAILLSSYASLGAASSHDLSRAVTAERAYGLQMNIKEAAMESISQGSLEGFADYDGSHDIRKCVHCPGVCAPPPSPDICDPAGCAQCFREDEARASAVEGAYLRLSSLSMHTFDDGFSATIVPPQIDVFLKPDPLSRNGFSVDHAVLRSPLEIGVASDGFEISASSGLPEGLVIG